MKFLKLFVFDLDVLANVGGMQGLLLATLNLSLSQRVQGWAFLAFVLLFFRSDSTCILFRKV